MFTESSAKVFPTCGVHLYQSLYQENKINSEVVDGLKTEQESNNAASVQENQHKNDKEYETNVKNKILEASLNQVSVHGWTKAAIVAGIYFLTK